MEFDPEKSAANLRKHGIDFIQSQELWDDEYGLEVTARSETEMRFALIAKWNTKLWTSIFTVREGRIRIISSLSSSGTCKSSGERRFNSRNS